MRELIEPSCRHLLRPPQLYGLPYELLIGVCLVTIGTQTIVFLATSGDLVFSVAGLGFSASLYFALRSLNRILLPGWEQSLLYLIEEKWPWMPSHQAKWKEISCDLPVLSPDTLDDEGLMASKLIYFEEISHLASEQELILKFSVTGEGTQVVRVVPEKNDSWGRIEYESPQGTSRLRHVYSLVAVPVATHPLWLSQQFSGQLAPIEVIVSVRGLDSFEVKRRVESYRRLHLLTGSDEDLDGEISFEDASHVLRGISKGNDGVVELSVLVCSHELLPLDHHYFRLERNPKLALTAGLGLRSNYLRRHWVRFVTATDLIPNLLDPVEGGASILTTLRGKPLYFDPMDPRLDALHWLVCGATGTGKSFFVGLVLHRLIQSNQPVSVLFLDHKRSFRRLVGSQRGLYLEPTTFEELVVGFQQIAHVLDQSGSLTGIELGDLPTSEKERGAGFILQLIAEYLTRRSSQHVIYLVIDECWKFLRKNSEGVEQAFREFRKLDAGVIAITQSVKDFISDQAGQAIIQNAEIVVLLRQKEDVRRFQDVFDLNEPELARVKQIKKKKGLYAECLIKTPFLSKFGRLCPTESEHELLRTDNLRQERVALSRAGGVKVLLVLFILSGIGMVGPNAEASFLGEETAVLIQMAGNQLSELEKLAETIGIAKEQRDLLLRINEGVYRTTSQIQSIQTIIQRSEGLDPKQVRDLAAINQSISTLKTTSSDLRALLQLKLDLCDEALAASGLQSGTAYQMGQEMERIGALLANESQTASPGRSQQISAAAASAQMLAQGVELQTLSQISQLLAFQVELQRTQLQKELHVENSKKRYWQGVLGKSQGFEKSQPKRRPS